MTWTALNYMWVPQYTFKSAQDGVAFLSKPGMARIDTGHATWSQDGDTWQLTDDVLGVLWRLREKHRARA